MSCVVDRSSQLPSNPTSSFLKSSDFLTQASFSDLLWHHCLHLWCKQELVPVPAVGFSYTNSNWWVSANSSPAQKGKTLQIQPKWMEFVSLPSFCQAENSDESHSGIGTWIRSVLSNLFLYLRAYGISMMRAQQYASRNCHWHYSEPILMTSKPSFR